MRHHLLYISLAAAVAAGVGTCNTANAVFLNPAGLGEVLVYPYYTVNGGNSTLLSVINTSGDGKAIKVRFLEGYNGRDVLDFNLYLSPHDTWVGSISAAGPGTAAGLLSNDNSCTVPKISSDVPLAFSTHAFDGTSAQGQDGGPTGVTRTREGYIELIEMGTVTNASNHSLDAITHSFDGVPSNCAQIVDAWSSSGYWTADPTVDIGPPTGGLAGNGTIVDVALGTVEGYVAEALAQFYPAGTNGTHTGVDSLTPNLSSATSLTTATYPNDVPLTSGFARGIDAVSAVFMADWINNEYWTGDGIGAASEWVVTSPTKRFYTDTYYAANGGVAPFDVRFSSALGGSSCVSTFANIFDREELTQGSGSINPQPPNNSKFCYATQTIAFNQGAGGGGIDGAALGKPSLILGSNLGFNFSAPDNGWATFYLGGRRLTASSEGHIFEGLPVTGFWVAQVVNNNVVNGVLANYTALYKHKAHSNCFVASGAACS